jgi:alkanesulfonate monooxygenase SsuD/methylene tetrahydromethanopterin reductase-like flavin-dependent oxidoreductase (luciferase family)
MGNVLFGLGVSPYLMPGFDPVGTGKRAEELGFDFLSTSDHPCTTEPNYEAWTLLSWIAASTNRIRIATRVLGVPYRPPAVVAKMAETFDRLSGGRLILGLGGGFSDNEFRAFGLRVPTAREKVDGLAEAIEITRGLWSETSFSYPGRLFHTDAADLTPKPEHRIPIWLGTFGPRALALTGRLADGWIPSHGHAPPETIPGLRNRIVTAALDARRDPDEITYAYHIQLNLNGTAEPGVLTGSPDRLAEQLAGFTKLGFTALSLVPVGDGRDEQLERIATEIIPAVRALL